jgi:FKBP-type peptidyl-prolyl cis-trans isomerase FklB
MPRPVRLTVLLILFATVNAAAQNPNATPSPSLATTADQASYAIGVNIGRSLKSNGVELNATALILGIQDMLAGSPQRLTDEQCRAAITVFEREVQAQLEEQRRAVGEKNKVDGQEFLTANQRKAGVVTLPSGLQYTVIKSGNGPTPAASDSVVTHYHGTLIDGTVFDSSVERDEPAEFPVGGVIRGWTEALQKMKVGDKWRLFVPSELAYGPRGAGQDIGPNAVLIFEIELLGIK